MLEPRVPKDPTLKRHPPNRNKCIEVKIINKKIRRVKNRRNKECLTAKRDVLRLELNWAARWALLRDGVLGNWKEHSVVLIGVIR